MSDKQSTKIALTSVASLERLLDEVPIQRPVEVSKRRAIGMLSPKLQQLRVKGYAWRDIAAWLTEHGVAISPAALQRYMRSNTAASRAANGRGVQRPSRSAQAPAPAAATVPTAPTRPALASKPPNVRDQPVPPPGTFFIRPDTKDL